MSLGLIRASKRGNRVVWNLRSAGDNVRISMLPRTLRHEVRQFAEGDADSGTLILGGLV
jgi:hypothetical protein